MKTKFCSVCGRKMVLVKTEVRGYSTKTGKPWFMDEFRCPENKGWKWWINGEHAYEFITRKG